MNVFMKLVTAGVLSLTLMGATCSQADIQSQVAQVQAITTKACAFLPTADVVVAMLTAVNPTVVGVSAIAHAICGAVESASHGGAATQGADNKCPLGKVNGVCIQGKKVE